MLETYECLARFACDALMSRWLAAHTGNHNSGDHSTALLLKSEAREK
jgi:hypothetical protein